MDAHFLSRIVAYHAVHRGSHPALIALEGGDEETERLDYATLDTRIAHMAAGLEAAGLRGRGLLIALPSGADFTALFLACLRAGTVAIPVPYPDTSRHVIRMTAIARDARPAAIVSDDVGLARCPSEIPRMTPALLAASPRPASITVEPGHVAFVQYTSGSTQAPKGVAITNGNLVANLRMIAAGASLDRSCISVTWLPHFHDMGLIGGICLPLYLGGTSISMPPQAFIKRPLRWLNAMHRYRATLSGGPCFGYDISARRLNPAPSTLDLSAWRIAYCGAEPVRAPVLRRFADLLAPARFDSSAFLPCYGLAEATLMATCPAPGTGIREVTLDRPTPGGRRPFVACGPPMPGSEIRIRAAAKSGWAGPGEVGEICIAGDHVSPGLWNGEGFPLQPFADRIVDEGTTYLRTGDLGAVIDGAVVPVDRIKDLIAIYGRKVHAVDVEATVLESCAKISSAAAIGVEEGEGERLVVLCEVRRSDMASVDARGLASAVANAHGLLPDIRLMLPGTLDRTSSGKVARFACRERFLRTTRTGSDVPALAGGVGHEEGEG